MSISSLIRRGLDIVKSAVQSASLTDGWGSIRPVRLIEITDFTFSSTQRTPLKPKQHLERLTKVPNKTRQSGMQSTLKTQKSYCSDSHGQFLKAKYGIAKVLADE